MIEKIISGGQPGAARAALDWAITHGVDYGGWCPKGRRVHDGELDSRYELLKETTDSHYRESKEWNVRDSDATVVFTLEPELHGHALKAHKIAIAAGKPCLHIAGASEQNGSAELRNFVEKNSVRTLNVAGSRESMELGIYLVTEDTLNDAFGCDSAAG